MLKWVLAAQLASVVGVEGRRILSIEQSNESRDFKVLPNFELMILKYWQGKKVGVARIRSEIFCSDPWEGTEWYTYLPVPECISFLNTNP